MEKKVEKFDKYCQKHGCRKEYWVNVAMPEGRWICIRCERERYSKVPERQFFQYAASSKKIGEKLK